MDLRLCPNGALLLDIAARCQQNNRRGSQQERCLIMDIERRSDTSMFYMRTRDSDIVGHTLTVPSTYGGRILWLGTYKVCVRRWKEDM